MADYFDSFEAKNPNLVDLKQTTVMCGYMNGLEIFWHKLPDNRWKFVSTEFEALSVGKFIPNDRVVELYFKLLESYIEVDSIEMSGHKNCTLNQVYIECDDTHSYNEFEDQKINYMVMMLFLKDMEKKAKF